MMIKIGGSKNRWSGGLKLETGGWGIDVYDFGAFLENLVRSLNCFGRTSVLVKHGGESIVYYFGAILKI